MKTATIVKKSTVAILREAADIIERDGYIKGTRHDGTGAVCAIGALERAAAGTRTHDGPFAESVCPEAMEALADMLPPIPAHDGTRGRHNGSTIAHWNNLTCNSAKEVACVMRAAAEFEEEKEKA